MQTAFETYFASLRGKKIAVLGEGKDMEIEMLAEDPDYEMGEDYFEG